MRPPVIAVSKQLFLGIDVADASRVVETRFIPEKGRMRRLHDTQLSGLRLHCTIGGN